MDILCVGEMVIDFLPGEEPGVYIRKAGGAPANVAIAAARNGLDAGFCGTVGDDDFGRFLRGVLRENQVKVMVDRYISHAVTTMAFVTLNETGNRSFTFARKPGADMFLAVDDIQEDWIKRSRVIHGGSCSLSRTPASEATAYALKRGHEEGKLVSFDVNYRSLLWDGKREEAAAAVRRILPFVDFLKISDEEADMADTGNGLMYTAKENQIAVLVETLGADGARCYWNDRVIAVKGLAAECVDTTGAGDAFWGGFLTSLLQDGIRRTSDLTEDILYKALRYGNLAGGLCVQKKGAVEALPTRDEILYSKLCERNG